jgi:transcriptional regulator with XRE-family HTH domain
MEKMTNPRPIEVWRPSELVGRNVRRLRDQRGWSQAKLADRLNEVLTDTPQWAVDLYEARRKDPSREPDSRERRPRKPATEPSNWNQVKIARLEKGKMARVGIDEIFELALALDVSPLFLIADGRDESDQPLPIRLSPTKYAWPHELRSWIRGARPMLTLDYPTEAEAMAGIHFYAIDSQPGESRVGSELRDDAEKGDELRRKWRPLKEMLEESGDAE